MSFTLWGKVGLDTKGFGVGVERAGMMLQKGLGKYSQNAAGDFKKAFFRTIGVGAAVGGVKGFLGDATEIKKLAIEMSASVEEANALAIALEEIGTNAPVDQIEALTDALLKSSQVMSGEVIKGAAEYDSKLRELKNTAKSFISETVFKTIPNGIASYVGAVTQLFRDPLSVVKKGGLLKEISDQYAAITEEDIEKSAPQVSQLSESGRQFIRDKYGEKEKESRVPSNRGQRITNDADPLARIGLYLSAATSFQVPYLIRIARATEATAERVKNGVMGTLKDYSTEV